MEMMLTFQPIYLKKQYARQVECFATTDKTCKNYRDLFEIENHQETLHLTTNVRSSVS